VSTAQVRLAGVGSVPPPVPIARTWKVCSPLARPEYSLGEGQALQVAPLRLHLKVEPGADEEKPKLAVVALTLPEGPEVKVVSGCCVMGCQRKWVKT
jgi:hypothetical protein